MTKKSSFIVALALGSILPLSAAPKHRLLFFTKSSGFEHSVISWKHGKPSLAEKVFTELGNKNDWEFVFSKDGSKFSPEYLAGFDAVIFYTTGNLLTAGADKQPPMTAAGKQALFDYVKGGKGFIGLHCASDTFHTPNEEKAGPERYVNQGDKADPYIRFLGGEFIMHGAQQPATNEVVDKTFPGFTTTGDKFTLTEEWYSLKDFTPDIHVITVIDAANMKGFPYNRPSYPTTWARMAGKGRVFYTAMGHRDDVWNSPFYQGVLVGAIRWVTGDVKADVTPNLKTAAPKAMTNPPFPWAKKKQAK